MWVLMTHFCTLGICISDWRDSSGILNLEATPVHIDNVGPRLFANEPNYSHDRLFQKSNNFDHGERLFGDNGHPQVGQRLFGDRLSEQSNNFDYGERLFGDNGHPQVGHPVTGEYFAIDNGQYDAPYEHDIWPQYHGGYNDVQLDPWKNQGALMQPYYRGDEDSCFEEDDCCCLDCGTPGGGGSVANVNVEMMKHVGQQKENMPELVLDEVYEDVDNEKAKDLQNLEDEAAVRIVYVSNVCQRNRGFDDEMAEEDREDRSLKKELPDDEWSAAQDGPLGHLEESIEEDRRNEELERREDRMHHLEEAIEEELRSRPDAEPTNKRINGLLTESLEEIENARSLEESLMEDHASPLVRVDKPRTEVICDHAERNERMMDRAKRHVEESVVNAELTADERAMAKSVVENERFLDNIS